MFPYPYKWMWKWIAFFETPDGQHLEVSSLGRYPSIKVAYAALKATCEHGWLVQQGVPVDSVSYDIQFVLTESIV